MCNGDDCTPRCVPEASLHSILESNRCAQCCLRLGVATRRPCIPADSHVAGAAAMRATQLPSGMASCTQALGGSAGGEEPRFLL